MIRTEEEIQKQINGLERMKGWLPEFSAFGDPNWEKINAQVDILNKSKDIDDFPEGDWEDMDNENQVYRAAEEAEEWLTGDYDHELFEEQ